MAQRMNLNKGVIGSIEPPAKGRAEIYDAKVPGLLVRVTPTGSTSFYVRKRVSGRPRYVRLGAWPDMTVHQARRQAQSTLSEIAEGVDPAAKRKAEKAQSLTLGEVLEAYLESRDLKPRTEADYRAAVRESFEDWRNKRLVDIDRDMVERRHRQRGEESPARANLAMRVLRALFNFAKARYENPDGSPLITENPVDRISATRSWHRVKRRKTVIRASDLPAWWDAVENLRSQRADSSSDYARDYLRLVLLTGMRESEAASLRWDQVDLEAATFTLPDPKNRESVELPLSGYAAGLLRRRREDLGPGAVYVFPGNTATGYMSRPKYWMERVQEESGVGFTLHDLRRTFTTVGEALDLPIYVLKRLLNHKTDTQDVTAGYIVSDVDRLRGPTQRITNKVLQLAGEGQGGEVVELPRSG